MYVTHCVKKQNKKPAISNLVCKMGISTYWCNGDIKLVCSVKHVSRGMPSSGMWRRVGLMWTDISEEHIASIFRVEKSASERDTSSHLLTLVPRLRIFLSWRWRRNVLPKRRFTQDLHGTTSQKTAFFINTAVKISRSSCLQKWRICWRRKSPYVRHSQKMGL
jgi:hypothetical protein